VRKEKKKKWVFFSVSFAIGALLVSF